MSTGSTSDTTRLTTGGRVQANDGIYVERQADADLLQVCRRGGLGVVLHSRQVGKSSLISHAAAVLRDDGFRTVAIDFTAFGVHDVKADDWYLAIVDEIGEQLELDVDTDTWWDEQGKRPPAYKLGRFLSDVVLPGVDERIVVFMDEIDTTLSLPFTDDLFAAIRECYQRRSEDEDFRRLSFVLVGSSSPTELMKDEKRTPFNIGTTIDIRDFSRQEIQAFAPALPLPAEQADRVLDWVHGWTGGHPYLTQVLCAHIVDEGSERWQEADVDELVHHVFLSTEAEQDFNLDNVRDMLTERWVRQGGDPRALLNVYLRVRQGRKVRVRSLTEVTQHLLLSGVVVADGGHLRIRNRIYATVFSPRWVRYHLPVNWRSVGIGVATAAVIVFLGAVAMQVDANRRDRRIARYEARTDETVAQMYRVKEWGEGLRAHLTSLRSAIIPEGATEAPVSSSEAELAYTGATMILDELDARESIPFATSVDPRAIRTEIHSTYEAFRAARARVLREQAERRREEDLQAYALYHAKAAQVQGAHVDTEVYLAVERVYGNVTAVMRASSPAEVAAFSPDGAELVTASQDGSIRRWDVETGLLIDPPVSTTTVVGFSPAFIGWQEVKGRAVILVTSKEPPYPMLELRITPKGLRNDDRMELGGIAYAARLSPDGSRLLTSGLPTSVWSYPDGELVNSTPLRTRRPRGYVFDAAYSRAGDLVATVRDDGLVELFDPDLERVQRPSIRTESNGQQLARIQIYEELDGERWLLTIPFEGSMEIHSIEDRTRLIEMSPPATPMIDARLCPPAPFAHEDSAAVLTVVGRIGKTETRVAQRFDVRINRQEHQAGDRLRITSVESIPPELRVDEKVLAIAPDCATVATARGDSLVKVRTLERTKEPERTGKALLDRWQGLFNRTVDGEKIVDSDDLERGYDPTRKRGGSSGSHSAGKMP